MCFFVAQFAKVSQMRTRYWNSVLKDTDSFTESYMANGFSHPNLLILSQPASAPTLHMASWGLIPAWAKDKQEAQQISNLTLNSRAETIFEKPSFEQAAKHSRCIIPVNGFYEWQHVGSKKQPYYISIKNDTLFSLGGLYSEWLDKDTGTTSHTFSIITVEANPLMQVIHNSKKRMPLIISRDKEEQWLNPNLSISDVKSVATPFPDTTMQAWQVAPFNPRSASGSNADLVKPLQDNSTLF
jgi:putative SOS response-associated peptidase YedK